MQLDDNKCALLTESQGPCLLIAVSVCFGMTTCFGVTTSALKSLNPRPCLLFAVSVQACMPGRACSSGMVTYPPVACTNNPKHSL